MMGKYAGKSIYQVFMILKKIENCNFNIISPYILNKIVLPYVFFCNSFKIVLSF